ncbi:hypothetical protein [Nocardia sp. NPDC019395]|uniref:hypothetical protein n=1 Tax=Nocardia sp. NPDC019395 TaxID=3154686 RepID=UPI0033FB1175
MSTVDLVKLHNDSRDLLERLADRLPPDRLADYRSDSDAGEWGVLLDALCARLVRRQIPVTLPERDILAGLLAMLEIVEEGEEDYAYLSDPSRVLSQLHVVPS